MIKFFRIIRQKMLAENKFSKYLFYAIGEIVLVVIGILIALQINNWNESKKNQDLISIYKSELVNDLLLDVSHFENHLSLATEENKCIDSIRTIFQNPYCTIDTLNNIVKNGLNFIRKEPYIMIASTEFPIINDNTFLSLQNSGQITLLENKLQEELVSFYGYTRKYSFMINEIIKNKNELYFDYIKFIPIKQSEYNIVDPILYDQIWKNVEWKNIQIKFVTLLNTYYELNLKTIFFNDMRLYKTNIMIEQLKSDLNK